MTPVAFQRDRHKALPCFTLYRSAVHHEMFCCCVCLEHERYSFCFEIHAQHEFFGWRVCLQLERYFFDFEIYAQGCVLTIILPQVFTEYLSVVNQFTIDKNATMRKSNVGTFTFVYVGVVSLKSCDILFGVKTDCLIKAPYSFDCQLTRDYIYRFPRTIKIVWLIWL